MKLSLKPSGRIPFLHGRPQRALLEDCRRRAIALSMRSVERCPFDPASGFFLLFLQQGILNLRGVKRFIPLTLGPMPITRYSPFGGSRL
jgi:hypothetical protein